MSVPKSKTKPAKGTENMYISSSGEDDEMWAQKEEVGVSRVKENRSTETKIHLLLHPVSPDDANVSLGKRKRVISNSTPKNRRPKRPKQEYTVESDSEEFDLSQEEIQLTDGDENEEAGSSSDEESKVIKKQKKKLTRRQKAMVAETTLDSGLQSLPMGNEKKEMTEEEKNKKSEKARRRKRQAERQQEEERRTVIERLLNKSNTKRKDNQVTILEKLKQEIDLDKCLRYAQNQVDNKIISTLTFPEGAVPSFEGPNKLPPIPKQILCGISGCNNIKKYNCATSHIPLCSFTCYQKQSSQISQK